MIDHNHQFAFFLQDLDGGGAERAIVSLAGNIAKLGYNVDLVVGDANSDYLSEVPSGISLVNFTVRSPFKIFFNLSRYLLRSKPSVIMSALDPPNIMLVAAAVITGFKGKTVISQRAVLDASLRELGAFRRMVTWILIRLSFPRADAIISNSRAAATELKIRLKVADNKLFTIQNAIDVERITQLANKSIDTRLFDEKEDSFILAVGSLTKRKDLKTLIKAFSIVRVQEAVRLVILGKGSEESSLKSLASTLGVSEHIYFAGFEPNPYKWIAAAAVFVSSSTEEGFPNVIAESLALDCPVVATDCPGDTADLLGYGQWGHLVPIGDEKCMSEAIISVLKNGSPGDGKLRAADFSPSGNISAYLNVLLPEDNSQNLTTHRL